MATIIVQNVSGTNANTGFFFGGFTTALNQVQVGWLAHGTGIESSARVVAVYPEIEVIEIDSAFSFLSGSFYYFTLPTVAGPADFVQNVAATVSSDGFFYNGFKTAALQNVVKGWLANGPGLMNAPVASVNVQTEHIILGTSFSFTPGQSYNFSPPLQSNTYQGI